MLVASGQSVALEKPIQELDAYSNMASRCRCYLVAIYLNDIQVFRFLVPTPRSFVVMYADDMSCRKLQLLLFQACEGDLNSLLYI